MADGEGTYDNVVEGEQLGEHGDVVNAEGAGGDAAPVEGGASAGEAVSVLLLLVHTPAMHGHPRLALCCPRAWLCSTASLRHRVRRRKPCLLHGLASQPTLSSLDLCQSRSGTRRANVY